MTRSCSGCNCNKEIKVSFCPKCKSHNVKYVFELGNLFGVMPKMRCEKCRLEMPSFPVLIVDKNKLNAAVKKMKKRVVKKTKKILRKK